MKFFHVSTLVLVALAGVNSKSWYGSDTPDYTKWDTKQLQTWLEQHKVDIPKAYHNSKEDLQNLVAQNWWSYTTWTNEQYNNAQKAFQNLKDSTFESWDESRLREFLLEQGIVEPKGPRENTDTTMKAFDDSKDYIYSTWDDSQMKDYLVSSGVLKSDGQKTRDQYLKLMKEHYAAVADPVWQAWSDSYIRDWLVNKGLVETDYQKNRDYLVEQMKKYYYDSPDKVYNTWSDSDLKSWLVNHNVIKSEAQVKRDKLIKLISDNFTNARDTVWSSWSDSEIRSWLIDNGYLKSDAQAERDELVNLIHEKYKDYSARSAAYLAWPDARLRAYLRTHGIPEDGLPTSRPGLLQETRIRYVRTTGSAQAFLNRIRDLVNSGVELTEEKIHQALGLLTGTYEDIKVSGEKRASEYEEDLKKKGEWLKGRAEDVRKKTEL
ncbi:hypothetical protein BDM02DRAFT_1766564 [Thelephora ganbajun]|uniref:Uncharacterized protein n=1 Tax=Thelephora ganbajun TaxID=370292 RepID=A0ACB6ZIS7_THEGA|nr:hypothetical protein BDM02DRAFT_1766564 [Thelephora ganbajun]